MLAPSPLAPLTQIQDGIVPAWEDPQNKNGGKWSIQVPKEKSKAQIDQMWLYTVSGRDTSHMTWLTVADARCDWRDIRNASYSGQRTSRASD